MTQNASDKAKGVPETPKKKLIEVAPPLDAISNCVGKIDLS